MGRKVSCRFAHFVFFAGLISCLGTAFCLDRVELRPEDFVYVCRNAGAGGYEAFPDVCLVDDVGGAYPSMVNLKDGSVRIVYYEEGEGSDIRARRFRATKSGIKWLKFDAGTGARRGGIQ